MVFKSEIPSSWDEVIGLTVSESRSAFIVSDETPLVSRKATFFSLEAFFIDSSSRNLLACSNNERSEEASDSDAVVLVAGVVVVAGRSSFAGCAVEGDGSLLG